MAAARAASEGQLDRKLYDAGIAVCRLDCSKARRSNRTGRGSEVHQIHHVEKLTSELSLHAFGHRDSLVDADVDIALARSAHRIAANVAEKISGSGECRYVEVGVHTALNRPGSLCRFASSSGGVIRPAACCSVKDRATAAGDENGVPDCPMATPETSQPAKTRCPNAVFASPNAGIS